MTETPLVHCESIFRRGAGICGWPVWGGTPDDTVHDGTQHPPITCPNCIAKLTR